jgi:hypothetical protein
MSAKTAAATRYEVGNRMSVRSGGDEQDTREAATIHGVPSADGGRGKINNNPSSRQE